MSLFYFRRYLVLPSAPAEDAPVLDSPIDEKSNQDNDIKSEQDKKDVLEPDFLNSATSNQHTDLKDNQDKEDLQPDSCIICLRMDPEFVEDIPVPNSYAQETSLTIIEIDQPLTSTDTDALAPFITGEETDVSEIPKDTEQQEVIADENSETKKETENIEEELETKKDSIVHNYVTTTENTQQEVEQEIIEEVEISKQTFIAEQVNQEELIGERIENPVSEDVAELVVVTEQSQSENDAGHLKSEAFGDATSLENSVIDDVDAEGKSLDGDLAPVENLAVVSVEDTKEELVEPKTIEDSESTIIEQLRKFDDNEILAAEQAAKAAEKERLAAEEAEKERLAAEEAEKERIAAEEAEKERLAAEEAEKERLAAEEAEKERIAAEEAEKEKLAAEEGEKERIAAEEAEKQRIAAEEDEKERLLRLVNELDLLPRPTPEKLVDASDIEIWQCDVGKFMIKTTHNEVTVKTYTAEISSVAGSFEIEHGYSKITPASLGSSLVMEKRNEDVIVDVSESLVEKQITDEDSSRKYEEENKEEDKTEKENDRKIEVEGVEEEGETIKVSSEGEFQEEQAGGLDDAQELEIYAPQQQLEEITEETTSEQVAHPLQEEFEAEKNYTGDALQVDDLVSLADSGVESRLTQKDSKQSDSDGMESSGPDKEYLDKEVSQSST